MHEKSVDRQSKQGKLWAVASDWASIHADLSIHMYILDLTLQNGCDARKRSLHKNAWHNFRFMQGGLVND